MQEETRTIEVEQELPLLTFNALYNVLREEKKSKSLQKFPPFFYEALEKFLFNKKEEIKRLKKENAPSLRKEEHVLHNAQKISEELFLQRGVKISKIALSNALSNDVILEEDFILEKELQLFDSVQKEIKKLSKIL